jgi:hypothetical protein
MKGHGLNRLGMLLEVSRPNEAETVLREALTVRHKLVADHPTVADYESDLGGICHNLGDFLAKQGKLVEARQLLVEAIARQQAALKSKPHNPVYRSFTCNHHALLGQLYNRAGDHAEAFKVARQLAQSTTDAPELKLASAEIMSNCVGVVDRDATLTPSQRHDLKETYARQAVNALNEAVGEGFKNVEALQNDRALDPIRDREDFRKLIDRTAARP